jgi:NDP-sugar pyrophosphorylase family protein
MKITKAIIFSAGLGTRFKPWTDAHPKALALINGKTLLQRNIEYLQQFGIRDVVVNVHHFADQIISAIEKNKGWGSQVSISDETKEVLETGGGLLKARTFFEGKDPFVSLNVDVLTNFDLHKLMHFHQENKPLVSFAVSNRNTSRYVLLNEQHRMCGWKNQTTGEERIVIPDQPLIARAYSCVVIYQPEIFSVIKQQGKFSIMETYLQLAADHTIMALEHSADKWVDVGRPESVAIAEALFND